MHEEFDEWLTYLFVLLDSAECEGCGQNPDLAACWPKNDADDAADQFAQKAKARLEGEGWQMIDGLPYCAECVNGRT